MDRFFKILHFISFLQYVFIAIALYYCYEPLFKGVRNFNIDMIIHNYNLGLLFLGVALSFASLADVNKRTKIGDKIFGKEKRAKLWLTLVCFLIVIVFVLGILCKFFMKDQALNNLSVGIFVFGIGMLGLLRMNLEIIKSYQKNWPKETN